MAKVRIYEVARRFNVSSEAMVNLLKEMKVPVKNHMSSIDDETIAQVAAKFEAEKEAVKQAAEEKKKKLDEAKRKRRAKQDDVKPRVETTGTGPAKPATATKGETREGPRRRRRRRRKVDQQAVEQNIRQTMAKMEGRTRRRKRVRREKPEITGHRDYRDVYGSWAHGHRKSAPRFRHHKPDLRGIRLCRAEAGSVCGK